MNVVIPRSTSTIFSRSTRTHHWEPLGDASMRQNNLNDTTVMSVAQAPEDPQAMEIANLKRILREKSEEILKLRTSLVVSLQCYAYVPAGNGPGSAAERRFLSAVSNAIAEPESAPPTLLVDQAPSHIQGVPTIPLPLEINAIMGQFQGFLQMLETEEKTLFKKSWKPRYVVADQHGITIYRDEADHKVHAFHKAVVYVPYHDLEFFVPSFRDASIPEMMERAATADDGTAAALTQMNLVAHQYAHSDGRNQYFGFVSKQMPNSQHKNHNPQIIFRTNSTQEHADWAHFLAKCFNLRLYRDMFPLMLAETMFGLLSKECQTEPNTLHAEIQTEDVVLVDQTHEVGSLDAWEGGDVLSPPPPPPPGDAPTGGLEAGDVEPLVFEPRTRDAETETDAVGRRVSGCQTDDLEQWVSAVPTSSTEVADSESVALQRHIIALQEHCKLIEGQYNEVKLERDEAVDHAAVLQQSIGIAEGETKRLRQMVMDEHENTLRTISDSRREDLEENKERIAKVTAAESEAASLRNEIGVLNQEITSLKEELVVSKEAFTQQLQALATKAVTDIDTLHDELLKADDLIAPPPMYSPPRGMLIEGTSLEWQDASFKSNGSAAPPGTERLGALEVFSNHVGDIQFNLALNDAVCSISETHELRAELRKVWRLRSSMTDGEIEISAQLRWDDEGDEKGLDRSTGSSVGLPAQWEEEDHPHQPHRPPFRHPSHGSNLAHGSAGGYADGSVELQTTQALLERLQRVTPALSGRVGLHHDKKAPFVPYVR